MNFTLFRALVLLWNNSPAWLRQLFRVTGVTWFVNCVWVPFRNLPIPPTEQPVKGLIEKIVQPGWACADVGANFGMMTEAMAAKAGSSGSIFAFEAHPLNATILRRRMEVKGFEKIVRIENKAVSDGAEKSLRLFAGRRKSPNEWNIVGHDVTGKKTSADIEIPAVSLDDYFKKEPLKFVKIDVEGAEIKVLPGMRRILREQKPVIIVEFHNPEAWEARHELFSAGYKIFNLTGKEISPTSPADYHVCAWPSGSMPPAGLFTAKSA
jgi:FkbM family methyltransferase